MDSQVLPLVLQHVRELVEAQMPSAADNRYKIITPFPPAFNDFADFSPDTLAFSDPEGDATAATKDTWNAYQFFTAVDGLYYDYSYGIRSPDQFLSQVCKKFVLDAVFKTTADTSFVAAFNEQKAAFQARFMRQTVGDLGLVDFYYTAPSPIQWASGRINLGESECRRLKEKVLALYSTIEAPGNDYLTALIREITAVAYTKLAYDYGFFDVTRAWVDPQLFENSGWKFRTPQEALYGANEADFQAQDVRLCFAQRFYIIKNYGGTRAASVTGTPTTASVTGQVTLRDHRTVVRNSQLGRTLTRNQSVKVAGGGRKGFIWVTDHWERQRAGRSLPAEPLPIIETDSSYKVAAVKCRIIPWKPSATA